MTAQLTLLGPNSSVTTGRSSSLWLAIRRPVTITIFAEWYYAVLAVFCWFRFDLFYFTSLSQLRPNYKLATLFFGMNRHHRVHYHVRSWWFVLEWTIVAKLLSFPWLLWFEITKVIWKPGCKKANRNCVLLQADDLGNYCVQQIREK